MLTVAGANSLAPCRKVQRLTDSHFSHVQVLLTDVHGRLLGHEFIQSVSIVCHVPLHLALENKSNTLKLHPP
jgi:hypothetical protein